MSLTAASAALCIAGDAVCAIGEPKTPTICVEPSIFIAPHYSQLTQRSNGIAVNVNYLSHRGSSHRCLTLKVSEAAKPRSLHWMDRCSVNPVLHNQENTMLSLYETTK